MVDIARPASVVRQKRIRRVIYGVVVLVAVIAISLGVSRLKPAAPGIDRGTVLIDKVKRGDMIRQVRGSGTLVPEQIRWIPANTEGRVERIIVQPGTPVKSETIILELSNAELQEQALAAELQLKEAAANAANQRAQLDGALLNQQGTIANVEAQYQQAKLQADADAELSKQGGLTSDLTVKLSRSRAEELRTRVEIEKKRLTSQAASMKAQLDAAQATVDRMRGTYELRRRQLDSLRVRAGTDGMLQIVPVEVGQRVTPGTPLARVANQTLLKAELRIAETQAKDIQIGQKAEIDTRNGIIPGRVSRIDPAVVNGTRTVDVALEAALPKGAVPDLSVDGTIELERLLNIMYVGRPAFGQETSTVTLFRIGPDGRTAERTKVRLGRSSVSMIEVVEGLQPGQEVVLSDMSAWDAVDRIVLN